MPLNILVIAASLRKGSYSTAMAKRAAQALEQLGATPRLMDLRGHQLPLCDGDEVSIDPQFAEAIRAADAILFATPVYNYDASAASKNLVEHTGKAWTGKVVGFLCAAGGHSSYMSIISLANSLMLDFRCIIIPRFVYATHHAFTGDALHDEKVIGRIDELASETVRIAAALKK